MSYVLDALKRSEQDRHQGKLPNFSESTGLMHTSKPKRALWPYVLIVVLVLNALVFLYIHLSGRQASDGQSKASDTLKTEASLVASKPAAQATIPTVEYAEPKPKPKPKPKAQGIDWAQKEREAKQLIQQRLQTQPSSATANTRDQLQASAPESSVAVASEPEIIRPKKVPAGGALPFPAPVVLDNTPTDVGQNMAPTEVSTQSPYASVSYLSELPTSQQPRVPALRFNSHIYSTEPSARRVMINNIYLREGQSLNGIEVLEIGEMDIVFSKDGQQFKLPAMRDWNG